MNTTLGALAAVGTACIWAFATTRYALAARVIGEARVSLVRVLAVLPFYLGLAMLVRGGAPWHGLDGHRTLFLCLSVLCSYGLADNLFFAAARRVGNTTALAVASSYPLWAAIVGAVWSGEALGRLRLVGMALSVGGVIALIAQAPSAAEEQPRAGAYQSGSGILLALATSLLWAGNTALTKWGGSGLPVVQANLVRFAGACAVLVPAARLLPRPSRDEAAARRAWRALVPVAWLEAGFGTSMFVYGLAHTPLAVGATLTSLSPVIAVPFALLYREERFRLGRVAAVLAAVGGAVLLSSM